MLPVAVENLGGHAGRNSGPAVEVMVYASRKIDAVLGKNQWNRVDQRCQPGVVECQRVMDMQDIRTERPEAPGKTEGCAGGERARLMMGMGLKHGDASRNRKCPLGGRRDLDDSDYISALLLLGGKMQNDALHPADLYVPYYM